MKSYHKIFLIVTLFSFLLHFQVHAQYFSTGQDPASIRWRQINTNHFQLIYPQEFEVKSQYLANVFEALYEKGGYSLKHQPRKFSVVLHTHGSVSNGLVAWAPKRMELYATPSQANYPQSWLDQLAIHEYRHVIQMDKVQQGFTRFLNFLFGEQATAAVVGLYIPPWFLEGDAVCAETAMSQSGRGRYPFFEQELRAQLLEKGPYSYDKAVLGSYKDFVPNRYKLGYYMVALGRLNYGSELWERTLNRVGRNPQGVTSFSSGLKETIGNKRQQIVDRKSTWLKGTEWYASHPIDLDSLFRSHERGDAKIVLYQDNMSELLWTWEIQDGKISPSEFRRLSSKTKIYTDYRYPHYNGQGETVVLKSGLADASCFVRICDGVEKKIFVPGYNFTSTFDLRNNVLLWCEIKDHVRWEHGDQSTVITYDITTGERKRIRHEHNLFAPTFSRDGKRILAVEVKSSGENSLVVLDTESGKVLQRMEASGQDFFMTPQWTEDETGIISVLLNKKGKQLVKVDLETGNTVELLAPSFTDIAQPHVHGKYLFFTGAFSGIDNIYAMNLKDQTISQVTSSRFGARDPQISGNGRKLVYSDYSADGYRVVETVLHPQDWKPFSGKAFVYDLADSISKQEKGLVDVDEKQLKQFESKPYSKLGHLFNIHSWAPVFIDGLEQQTDIGVSLATQNKLNTLLATAGYRKQQGFENGQYYFNMSYRGWFPVIDSKVTYGAQKYYLRGVAENLETKELDTIVAQEKHGLWSWENSISFPLNISCGQFNRRIIPKITYTKHQWTNREITPLYVLKKGSIQVPGKYNINENGYSLDAMEYQLLAYNISKSAPRDLQPPWGQILELNYRHTPWGDFDFGKSWSGEGWFYLPGILRHHGIKLYASYQRRTQVESSFANTILSPRGTSDLFGEHISSLGVDYKFPFAYPDWNLGALAYFKRLKANLFFDHGFQKGTIADFSFKQNRNSFGLELNADMHVLRFSAPIDFGIRLGFEDYSKNKLSSFAELLFSIDLSSY